MAETTMKFSVSFCASLIGFGVIPSLGQSSWFWHYAVSVLDSDTVTAVGTDRTIVRTTDGGDTGESAQIAEIKKLERDRLAAGVRKDVEAVSSATADDYIQIEVDGKVLDKRLC
jgi:hypothetical protein